MAQLYSKVKIYLGRDFTMEEVRIVKEPSTTNYSIAEWNISDEKVQPTVEQLNALESQADELEALNQVYAKRKAEYPTIEECVHAILDDDLENLQILRQAVKDKFPKENA